MKEDELNRIIQACLKGERSSQKMIFDMFSTKMMTVCLRYTKNRKDAEDVLQDGFVRLYTNLNQFAFKGSFEGWARRIFVHTSLRFLQKKKRSVELNENMIAPLWFVDEIVENHKPKRILKLIASLPEGYRTVFNLYVIEGYDHAEIATILKISASTSRSQLSKSRKLLQSEIVKLKLM